MIRLLFVSKLLFLIYILSVFTRDWRYLNIGALIKLTAGFSQNEHFQGHIKD